MGGQGHWVAGRGGYGRLARNGQRRVNNYAGTQCLEAVAVDSRRAMSGQ